MLAEKLRLTRFDELGVLVDGARTLRRPRGRGRPASTHPRCGDTRRVVASAARSGERGVRQLDVGRAPAASNRADRRADE
jgi:hypothetical protein